MMGEGRREADLRLSMRDDEAILVGGLVGLLGFDSPRWWL